MKTRSKMGQDSLLCRRKVGPEQVEWRLALGQIRCSLVSSILMASSSKMCSCHLLTDCRSATPHYITSSLVFHGLAGWDGNVAQWIESLLSMQEALSPTLHSQHHTALGVYTYSPST